MKIVKFGGSSLADGERIKKICDIVLADPDRGIIVVSAPGKSENDPCKVTDMLIESATAALTAGLDNARRYMDQIVARFVCIAGELGVPEAGEGVKTDLYALLSREMVSRKNFVDMMKAAGEDNCAKLVAAYITSLGHKAVYANPGEFGMLLSDEFGNATVLEKSFPLLRENLAAMDGIVIFPGFFGRTEAGEVATFPRGGSDTTGAILAAAVKADVYENFTDVDYVYAVNPKLVRNPKPIEIVTYREMRELSYAGFQVYQEEALLPVYQAGIPVNIRSVNNPTCPGTRVVARREGEAGSVSGVSGSARIAGIAADNGFTSIYVTKYLMNREIGFGRRLLTIIEDEGVSYEHTPTGIDDVTVILRDSLLANGKLERIIERIKAELLPDDIRIVRDLSLLVVVGEGMKHGIGIAATATSALSKAGVNISMISQGSSEVSMIFAVESGHADDGVRALYEAFFE
ncbi:MAG: aspartate kinase [Peptococcaceae bacterium]|nr:aspartate kinase [Peptococcaceae bacterium]